MNSESGTWAERARRLLEELEAERLTPGRRAQERLRWEDGESLRKHALEFAAKEIRKRKWRGAADGVLPEGLDAEDLADYAIYNMLSGRAKLALGWVRARLAGELERLVSNRLRALHGRKEAAMVRSEWDVVGREKDEELVSVFELMGSPMGNGREEVVEREESSERERTRRKFEDSLGQGKLRWVYRCLCIGVTKPQDMARLLSLDEKSVRSARRMLERRAAAFVTQTQKLKR
jgi:hypothetical protein